MTSSASFHQKNTELDFPINPDTKMTYSGLIMWGWIIKNPIFQSEWDKPLYEARFDLLLHSATSEAERARLLSVTSEGASDWLHAIPIPSLGLPNVSTYSLQSPTWRNPLPSS